jgi:hypothetical protein
LIAEAKKKKKRKKRNRPNKLERKESLNSSLRGKGTPVQIPVAEPSRPQQTPIAEAPRPQQTPIAEALRPQQTPIAEAPRPQQTPVAELVPARLQQMELTPASPTNNINAASSFAGSVLSPQRELGRYQLGHVSMHFKLEEPLNAAALLIGSEFSIVKHFSAASGLGILIWSGEECSTVAVAWPSASTPLVASLLAWCDAARGLETHLECTQGTTLRLNFVLFMKIKLGASNKIDSHILMHLQLPASSAFGQCGAYGCILCKKSVSEPFKLEKLYEECRDSTHKTEKSILLQVLFCGNMNDWLIKAHCGGTSSLFESAFRSSLSSSISPFSSCSSSSFSSSSSFTSVLPEMPSLDKAYLICAATTHFSFEPPSLTYSYYSHSSALESLAKSYAQPYQRICQVLLPANLATIAGAEGDEAIYLRVPAGTPVTPYQFADGNLERCLPLLSPQHIIRVDPPITQHVPAAPSLLSPSIIPCAYLPSELKGHCLIFLLPTEVYQMSLVDTDWQEACLKFLRNDVPAFRNILLERKRTSDSPVDASLRKMMKTALLSGFDPLMPHQRRSLEWMIQREKFPALIPHPFRRYLSLNNNDSIFAKAYLNEGLLETPTSSQMRFSCAASPSSPSLSSGVTHSSSSSSFSSASSTLSSFSSSSSSSSSSSPSCSSASSSSSSYFSLSSSLLSAPSFSSSSFAPHLVRDIRGGILADEPGLGKTVTVLALISRSYAQLGEQLPVLPLRVLLCFMLDALIEWDRSASNSDILTQSQGFFYHTTSAESLFKHRRLSNLFAQAFCQKHPPDISLKQIYSFASEGSYSSIAQVTDDIRAMARSWLVFEHQLTCLSSLSSPPQSPSCDASSPQLPTSSFPTESSNAPLPLSPAKVVSLHQATQPSLSKRSKPTSLNVSSEAECSPTKRSKTTSSKKSSVVQQPKPSLSFLVFRLLTYWQHLVNHVHLLALRLCFYQPQSRSRHRDTFRSGGMQMQTSSRPATTQGDPSYGLVATPGHLNQLLVPIESALAMKLLPALTSASTPAARTGPTCGSFQALDQQEVFQRVQIDEQLIEEQMLAAFETFVSQSQLKLGGPDRARSLFRTTATLVIVPNMSMVTQWRSEILKFIPWTKVAVFDAERDHTPLEFDAEARISSSQLAHMHVVIVSLISISSERAKRALSCVHWRRVVIDEGHALGTRSSALSAREGLLISLTADYRWSLTGTPAQDKLAADKPSDLLGLFHQLRFLRDPVGAHHQSFDFIESQWMLSRSWAWVWLQEMLQRLLIRHSKSEIVSPVKHLRWVLQIDPKQALIYNMVVAQARRNLMYTHFDPLFYGSHSYLHPGNKDVAQDLLQSLRRVCNVHSDLQPVHLNAEWESVQRKLRRCAAGHWLFLKNRNHWNLAAVKRFLRGNNDESNDFRAFFEQKIERLSAVTVAKKGRCDSCGLTDQPLPIFTPCFHILCITCAMRAHLFPKAFTEPTQPSMPLPFLLHERHPLALSASVASSASNLHDQQEYVMCREHVVDPESEDDEKANDIAQEKRDDANLKELKAVPISTLRTMSTQELTHRELRIKHLERSKRRRGLQARLAAASSPTVAVAPSNADAGVLLQNLQKVTKLLKFPHLFIF